MGTFIYTRTTRTHKLRGVEFNNNNNRTTLILTMGLFDFVNPKKRAETRLLDQIFNLKFTAKSLNRSAQKCLKDESNLKSKCKLAMKNGNTEGAKIYATDAIRKKTRTVKLTPTGEPVRRSREPVGDASEDEFGERSDAKSGERTGPVAKSERHRES